MAQEFFPQRVLASEERSGFYVREHVRAEGKGTSQSAPSAVCTGKPLKRGQSRYWRQTAFHHGSSDPVRNAS